MQGNIVDMLYAPLSAFEVTLAIILAAVTRSIVIAIISILVFSVIVDLNFYNFFYILTLVLGCFILDL